MVERHNMSIHFRFSAKAVEEKKQSQEWMEGLANRRQVLICSLITWWLILLID